MTTARLHTPWHTAKLIEDLIATNCSEFISRDHWPPNSYDLSYLHGLWCLGSYARLTLWTTLYTVQCIYPTILGLCKGNPLVCRNLPCLFYNTWYHEWISTVIANITRSVFLTLNCALYFCRAYAMPCLSTKSAELGNHEFPLAYCRSWWQWISIDMCCDFILFSCRCIGFCGHGMLYSNS